MYKMVSTHVLFFKSHDKVTIWKPDNNVWSLNGMDHLNTRLVKKRRKNYRLVQYSDGYCIKCCLTIGYWVWNICCSFSCGLPILQAGEVHGVGWPGTGSHGIHSANRPDVKQIRIYTIANLYTPARNTILKMGGVKNLDRSSNSAWSDVCFT